MCGEGGEREDGDHRGRHLEACAQWWLLRPEVPYVYFSVPLMRFLGLPPYLGPSFFKKCTGGNWRVGSSYEVLSKTAHALLLVFCLFV